MLRFKGKSNMILLAYNYNCNLVGRCELFIANGFDTNLPYPRPTAQFPGCETTSWITIIAYLKQYIK